MRVIPHLLQSQMHVCHCPFFIFLGGHIPNEFPSQHRAACDLREAQSLQYFRDLNDLNIMKNFLSLEMEEIHEDVVERDNFRAFLFHSMFMRIIPHLLQSQTHACFLYFVGGHIPDEFFIQHRRACGLREVQGYSMSVTEGKIDSR